MRGRRVAIGGGNFGGAGSPSALIGAGLDAPGAHRVLDTAERLGITIVDTAFSYAAGASQEMIGIWLAADPDRAGRMTIVDKVGVIERDGELQLDLSFESVIAHAEAGRSRLGVDAVDVVMCHAPDPETPAEESLSAFGSLIDAGLAGGWGASNIDGPTLTEWLEAARQIGLPAPIFVENCYNLLQREAGETVLPICREHEIGFLAYSPLASGLLTGKYRRDEPPPEGSMMALRPDMAADFDDRAAHIIAAVTEVAAAHGVSNAAVAISWLLSQPGVIPIAGPSKGHHMDAVEHALDLALSETDIERLS
ncbi:MAG TPA: aldo/keto reductase [Acidimicrobiia bacterium]|nr:aldo/keto reductase [Acidimicrobiia bacterium]